MDFKYDYLIKSSNINFSRKVIGSDNELLTYYIDSNIGSQDLDRYYYSSNGYIHNHKAINIITIKDDLGYTNYIRNLFNRLDPIIDLDFNEMFHNNGSKLDIYSLSFSSNFDNNTVGQAIQQETILGSWFDILWLSTSQDSINNFDKNTIIHEVGHALGLSHPNDDPSDERWTSEDTIMSYNQGDQGWNIWFSEHDINALLKIWGRENDDKSITFDKDFKEYRFHRSKNKSYSIKTEIGKEDITGMTQLIFSDQSLNVEKDIIGVFDQITGIRDITGKIFRLYNSALSRFPDPEGLAYWIEMNQHKKNTYRQTSESFVLSTEFTEKYGRDITNENYLKALYSNILEREYDAEGLEYWLGQLDQGLETKGEVLMGFSESSENIQIFSDTTGIT